VCAARSSHASGDDLQSAVVYPNGETVDVPTNTRIWAQEVEHLPCMDPVLNAGSSSLELETSELSVGGATVLVLTPLQPLEPNLVHTWPCAPFDTFMPEAGGDHAAPEVPAVIGWESHGEYVVLSRLRESDSFIVTDINGGADFDPETLSGTLSSFGGAALGPATCGSDCFAAGHAEVRVGALDLAGNFSGWSEPVSVEPAGCAIGASVRSEPFPLSMTFLALIACRRQTWPPRRP
jgi:hypothetical protein